MNDVTKTPPEIGNHWKNRGFRVEVLNTQSHAFPAKSAPGTSAPSPQPSAPQATPQQMATPQRPLATNTNAAKLPPGHPLAQHPAHPIPVSAPAPAPAPAPGPAAAGTEPVRPQSETDPAYYSIMLPSMGHFYPHNLSIRNIKGVHQAKFSRAAKERNLRYVVEAISSTIGDGRSAFDLTPADWMFVMHWQRVSSYPKNPRIINWRCTNDLHVAWTLLRHDHPDYRPAKTLEIELMIDRSTLETIHMDHWDPTPYAELDAKYGLDVERMSDVVEWVDIQEELELEGNRQNVTVEQQAQFENNLDEMRWWSGRAAFLKRAPGRATLKERMALVQEMDPDEIQVLEEYIDAVSGYGVVERVNLKCKECGAHHGVPISVDALDFLPSSK